MTHQQTVYPPHLYAGLRTFYENVVAVESEPVVLRIAGDERSEGEQSVEQPDQDVLVDAEEGL